MSVPADPSLAAAGPVPAAARPVGEALLWLLLLGPVFTLVYVGCNAYAAGLPPAAVHHLAFGWERGIPFVPWTVIPYESIYLLYAVSPFLCRRRAELRCYALRFVMVTAVCAAVFLAYPLCFDRQRPPLAGLCGFLFHLLDSVDRPYNQLPSLHVALLVVLNVSLAGSLSRPMRLLLGGLSLLIVISVLTTWQHHVLDVLAGLAVGSATCLLVTGPALSMRLRLIPALVGRGSQPAGGG